MRRFRGGTIRGGGAKSGPKKGLGGEKGGEGHMGGFRGGTKRGGGAKSGPKRGWGGHVGCFGGAIKRGVKKWPKKGAGGGKGGDHFAKFREVEESFGIMSKKN